MDLADLHIGDTVYLVARGLAPPREAWRTPRVTVEAITPTGMVAVSIPQGRTVIVYPTMLRRTQPPPPRRREPPPPPPPDPDQPGLW